MDQNQNIEITGKVTLNLASGGRVRWSLPVAIDGKHRQLTAAKRSILKARLKNNHGVEMPVEFWEDVTEIRQYNGKTKTK